VNTEPVFHLSDANYDELWNFEAMAFKRPRASDALVKIGVAVK